MTQTKFIIVVFLVLTLMGCNSIGANKASKGPITINPANPSIVILGRRHVSQIETEVDYVSCIGDNLKDRLDATNIIPEQQFIDELYPYFEKSTAPLNVRNLAKMVKEPAIAKKLDDLNLSYLVWVEGKTQRTGGSGAVSCAIGPGGGCFGFATWDDEANYGASVWDVSNLAQSASVNTQRNGTSYLPAFIIPIPLLAQVQDTACNDMARRITQHIKY